MKVDPLKKASSIENPAPGYRQTNVRAPLAEIISKSEDTCCLAHRDVVV